MKNSTISTIDSFFEGEDNFICNASNFASLIFNELSDLNWVGFYLDTGKDLLLGPFQGKPACIRIPYDKGVCGAAATNKTTLLVDDVLSFPGHIACDAASRSELVIPMIKNGKFYGVLDIDSPVQARFTEELKIELEKALEVLLNSSDLEKVSLYFYKGLSE